MVRTTAGVLAAVVMAAPCANGAADARARALRRIHAAARADTASARTRGLPVARVLILAHDVYDTDSTSRLAPMHRLANRLHITTRPGTVRHELLFHPGDAWDDAIGRETTRKLRALDYLNPRRVQPVRVGDSVSVTVETRDVWTTSPEINLESGGGKRTGSVGFTERNLLGFGKSISLAYREDAHGVSRHVDYDDPNVHGTHAQIHAGGGKGAEGATQYLESGLPFYAEHTPRAFDAAWSRETSVLHLFSSAEEVANLDLRQERFSAWYGRMLSDGHIITRGTLVFESVDRRLGASRLEPGAPPSFAGGVENVRLRTLAADLRVWRPKFVEVEDVNRLDRVEDFDLGSSISVRAGVAPRAFGSTRNEGMMRIQADAGFENGVGFGTLHAETGSRLKPSVEDLVTQVDAHAYVLALPRQTFALAAYGIAGTNTGRTFQAVVGGLNGLRAYPVQAVAGRRLWRLNAEDRVTFSPERWDLVRLGAAVFYDAARAWGPEAAGTDWFTDAGVGVRIGLPVLGLSQVLRIDVAWPIRPTRDGGHAAVLSFGSSQAF